jgi:tetratricopeptide (TPR) repeat protein
VFSLFSSVVISQDTVNFTNIDIKTYGFATFAEWDSLIHYGKLGLANDIDYFYLRLRLGEAYYYKQNYAAAIKHFENALKNNSGDTSTQEFLYYSYLFSGRENDARFLGTKMTDDTKKTVHLKKDISLKNIYFETGPSFSNNINKNENINLKGTENINGNTDMTGNVYYAHFGLDINIGKWLSIYPGVSYVNDNKLRIFQMTEYKPIGRNINTRDTIIVHPGKNGHPDFTSYDTITEIRHIRKLTDTSCNFKYNLKQMEFYLKGNIHIAKGLDIIPFFHLLSIKTTMFKINQANIYDTIIRHTQVPKPPSSAKDTIVYQYANPLPDKFNIKEADTSYYNYSFGLSVNKNWGKISTALFASYSNLNHRIQKEGGLTVTWYPEGNLNLYFSSTLTAFEDDTVKNIVPKKFPGMKNIVFNQIAGTKINKFLWLEGFATFGSFSNFTEGNGFVVNNNPDLVNFRCGITPMFIFKHFDISLNCQFIEKEGSYVTNVSQTENRTSFYKYNNYFITGGIKWKL